MALNLDPRSTFPFSGIEDGWLFLFYTIFLFYSNGQKYVEGSSPANINFKEEMKEGSIPFDPVKLPSWDETRYLK